MTGGTRAAALSQHGHVGPLGEAPGRRGGSPGSRDTGRLGFLGPPLRRDPAPSDILTFRGVAKPRGARGAHSLRAARARLRNILLWASPEGARPAPLSALTWASRAGRGVGGGGLCGRRRAPSPHGLAPGPPGRRARTRSFSRSLLSALALSFPRGGGGALGPQVGGVGLWDLQDAAHGADRPHQLLGRGRGLRHGTPRLRAALRGGPGRG